MSFPRPDELATDSRIQASQNEDRMIKSGAKTLAKTGLALAGAGIASRVAPFLSGVIPTDLALKGISKVAPKVGDFLQKGMAQGLTIQSGLDFLKQNMGTEKAEAQEPAKENRNIIKQYSPLLFKEIEQALKRGKTPFEAGQIARNMNSSEEGAIKNMEKDHKAKFIDIVESVFGNGLTAQPQQNQQPQAQQMQQGQLQQNQSGGNWGQVAEQLQNILKM